MDGFLCDSSEPLISPSHSSGNDKDGFGTRPAGRRKRPAITAKERSVRKISGGEIESAIVTSWRATNPELSPSHQTPSLPLSTERPSLFWTASTRLRIRIRIRVSCSSFIVVVVVVVIWKSSSSLFLSLSLLTPLASARVSLLCSFCDMLPCPKHRQTSFLFCVLG